MKKNIKSKLVLRPEQIVVLDRQDIVNVQGGGAPFTGFISRCRVCLTQNC